MPHRHGPTGLMCRWCAGLSRTAALSLRYTSATCCGPWKRVIWPRGPCSCKPAGASTPAASSAAIFSSGTWRRCHLPLTAGGTVRWKGTGAGTCACRITSGRSSCLSTTRFAPPRPATPYSTPPATASQRPDPKSCGWRSLQRQWSLPSSVRGCAARRSQAVRGAAAACDCAESPASPTRACTATTAVSSQASAWSLGGTCCWERRRRCLWNTRR
mmetsp:Transcript_3197/g.10724  ORF Transcript_3197/g.10724 Transcript_3197/m.10724 type:complete len:215 (-) Transcript_3197:338-982(-)